MRLFQTTFTVLISTILISCSSSKPVSRNVDTEVGNQDELEKSVTIESKYQFDDLSELKSMEELDLKLEPIWRARLDATGYKYFPPREAESLRTPEQEFMRVRFDTILDLEDNQGYDLYISTYIDRAYGFSAWMHAGSFGNMTKEPRKDFGTKKYHYGKLVSENELALTRPAKQVQFLVHSRGEEDLIDYPQLDIQLYSE